LSHFYLNSLTSDEFFLTWRDSTTEAFHSTSQSELFKSRLSNQLNPKDPLFILAHQINWSVFEEEFGSFYKAGPGQPPKPIRLMVRLIDDAPTHEWASRWAPWAEKEVFLEIPHPSLTGKNRFFINWIKAKLNAW